jgi:hypothetical protein
MTATPADAPPDVRRNGAGRDEPDVSVTQAFDLGWNLCLLYVAGAAPERPDYPEPPPRLPSPPRFPESQRSLIRLSQVKSSIDSLDRRFPAGAGGGSPFGAAGVQIDALMPGDGAVVFGGDPRVNICQAHLHLAEALSVSDPGLAKAYHLGCDLAYTCYAPRDVASLKEQFKRKRVAQLGEALADLTSVLPEHAGRAVRLSCCEWQRWVKGPQIEDSGGSSGDGGTPGRSRLGFGQQQFDWPTDGEKILRALRRQGEIWRALLSGEKHGEEMLELQAYFATGARALKHVFKLLRGLLIPIVIALLFLAIGAWLLVKDEGAAATAAGLVTVAGAVGITWKGILGGLGAVVAKVQGPVWGAALDEEIATSITCLPEGAKEISTRPDQAAPASGPQPEALADEPPPGQAESVDQPAPV